MIGRRGHPSTDETDKPKGFDDFELRLGDVMRGERATMAKSLLDVQRELKIKASYIAAIENCDVSAFETPGFVAGYVRSYARYLGMDAEWAFRRFCDEANFTVAHGMSAAASNRRTLPRSKITYNEPLANPKAPFVPQGEAFLSNIQPSAVGSIFVLLLLIGGIGYGGWTVFEEVQKVQLAPVEQAPGVIAELDPLAQAGAKLASQTATSEIALGALPGRDMALPAPEALDRLYRPEALDVPVMVARDGPIAAIDPRTVGALASFNKPVPVEIETPIDETPVQVVAADVPAVELLAVRPSWVRVQAADGTVILEKILDAGERYALPKLEAAPMLRVGESGALYFAVNGETYGPAGARGMVTKNVELSPLALTAKYALADLSGDADLAQFVAVADAAAVTGVEPASE